MGTVRLEGRVRVRESRKGEEDKAVFHNAASWVYIFESRGEQLWREERYAITPERSLLMIQLKREKKMENRCDVGKAVLWHPRVLKLAFQPQN